MKIDKDYEDILGKIESKGCLDFTLDSKLREADTGQHLWSVYVCDKNIIYINQELVIFDTFVFLKTEILEFIKS